MIVNINILFIIANKLNIHDIKNFSLCCHLTYSITDTIRYKIISAKTIWKWWQYYQSI